MSWLKNLFGVNNSPFNYHTQKTKIDHFSFTVQDLKSWCKEELPALGWQKLQLRIAKQAKEKYNFCFNEVPDNTLVPEELLELIDANIYELFNKRFLNK